MQSNSTSAAWLDINKAWESVAELKYELQKTEMKLKEASRPYWRSNENFSKLEELKPSKLRIVDASLINKDIENVYNHKSNTTSTKFQFDFKTVAKNETDSLKDVNNKGPLHSWENLARFHENKTRTVPEFKKQPVEMLSFSINKNNYENTEIDASVLDTKIRYINDHITLPVSKADTLNKKHPEWIKSTAKVPSQQGFQKIREVVEKQKQQLQIKSFQMETRIKSNENIKQPLDTVSKEKEDESKNAIHISSDKILSTTVDPEKSPNRKTVTASLPLSYKGFAHFGDKINKVKDEIHHAKPIKSAQKQKMKRIKRIVNTSDKTAFITPSCWREAQELIRKKLGPFSTEISDSESKKLSSNKTESCSKQECIISDSDDDLPDIIEKTDEKMDEQNLDIDKQTNKEQNNCDEYKVISEDVNWKEGEMNERKQFSLKQITRRKRKTKQKEEKNISTSKVRHYDPHVIRHYIAKQKLERQKKRKEEKQKQLLEKQNKEQRLQDLYAFQKQVFSNYPLATRGTTSIANNKSKQFTEHIYLDLMLSEDKSVSTVSSQLVNLNSKKSKFKQLEEKQFDVNTTKNTQTEIPNNNLESLAKNVLSTDKLSSLESSINTDEDIGNNYVQITHINCDINKKIPPSDKSAEDKIDVTRNDYIQETKINSNTNEEIISSEKSIQDNIVSDERLTMLKAFATSIQNQIDLETERIKGFLFQKSIMQTSNPAISEIHQDVGKSGQQFVAGSSKKISEENYKILPGVQNVHSHVLEVIEKKKTVAAIKIQSVYRGYVARKAYKEMKNISNNLNKVNESLSEGPLESEEDIKSPQSILNKTDTEEEEKDLEVINQSEINQSLEIQTEAHSQHSDNVESFHYSSDFISIKEDVSTHSDLPSVLSINSSKKIELNSKSDQSTLKNSISESFLMENKENMSDANDDEIISVQSENSKTDSNESKPCSEILSEIISHKETTEHELNSNISTSFSEGPLSSIHESEINYSEYLEKNDKEDSYSDSEKSSAVDSYNKSDNIEQVFSNILDTVTGKTSEKISSNVIENKSVKTETVQTASNFSNYSYESSLSGSEKEVKDSVSDEEENSNTIKRSIEEKSTSISDYSLSNGSEISNPSISRENENLSNVQLSTVSKVIETEIPEVVGTCISAELSCLETLNNSLLYLNDYRQLNELISHQKDVFNFAHILQLQGDKQQEQQQRMFQALLHQQENQTRLLEESRAEQRQLIQNTIAEAHAAISEKTLKIVEAQAQAVKSSADALLQLTENHHAAKKELYSEYSNDFEQVETSNHYQSSGKSSEISSQSNSQSSNSSISEDLTVLTEKQNDTFSGNSNIESQSRSKNNELSKYTLSQLSKNTIEESVPESLEQGSITDVQKASISNPVHSSHEDYNLTNKSVQVPSISSHNQICKSVSTVSDMGSLFSIDQFSPNVDEHFNGELQSLVSSDSFTKFTLDMVNQLTQEEKLRNRHQLARLRLQEKELMEKTKAELSCLELLKKKLRQKGALEKVPSVRKRQRALLLQLHQERAQLRWLQEIHRNSLRKISRKEQRKLHTKETQNVPLAVMQHSQSQDSKSLMSSTTDSVPSEIEAKSTVDSDSHSEIPSVISSVYSSSDSANKNMEGVKSKISSKSSNSHVSTDIQSCKHSNQSLESLLQRFKKLENSKRYLTKREQKLLERRQEVENLLIWKQKLDAEENEIRGIEKKLFEMEKKQKSSSSISKSLHEDKKTTNSIKTEQSSKSSIQTDVEVSPGSSIESQGNNNRGKSESESSVAEDVIISEYQSQIISSNIQEEISTESKKQLSETEIYSESFESTDHSNIDSQLQNGTVPKQKYRGLNKKPPAMIRIPLVPHTHHRHDSSGSDDSFTVSQSETASDQSDIEGRILALSDELKRRQLEVSRLKKEQKRIYREQLKERELSLQKQIEAYDQYIQKAKKELEQKLEPSGTWYTSLETTPVKPQIKQPRVAESRRLRRNVANGDNLSPPSEVLKVSISSKSEIEEAISRVGDKEQCLPHSSVSSVEDKKTLGSQSSEENTSKIISGENEDHSLTPSASLISSEISQDEISKESLKENSDDIEEHVDLSEKSGLTQSEIKNTVIQETTNTAQENDNTENDLNISEDLEVLSEAAETLSSEKSSRSTETITDSSNKSGNKKDETQKSNAEISAQSLDDKKIKKENLVDDITENIFQWLYTDTVDTIKTRTLNQKIISSSENSSTEIVDKSKKKPSDFISENLSEYLIEDSVDCMLQITREKKDINISASESKNVKKDVSDITEKVTRILATLNDRKSVQSKSRPQDLMILSPLLDNLEDNNWEITTDLEIEKAEMTSSFEPVLLNQKSDFLEESEWFDDDFGFENKEAQLAQEEMPPHYQNYYRQIPNKPPPPYIPPSALPFSKFEPKKNESFSVIVNDPKEIQDMVTEMALTLKDNINIYQFNEENAENSDLATESQVLYKQFLCDLTRDMILNLNSKANEKPAPWTKTWKLTQKSFPRDGEQFVNTVVEKTLQLLGIKNIATESKKNESVMKLGRKKRDFVDNILIKELREEECSWVNYEQDEIFIKTELSDAIFDILVDDTVSLIGKLQQRV